MSWPWDTVPSERTAEHPRAAARPPGETVHTTLYVGSLASQEDGRELTRLCAEYGTVVYAKVVAADPDLFRRDGGFGVLEMDTPQAARDAIRALNGLRFRGRTLTVRAATAAEETAAGHPRMFTSMNMGDDDDDTKEKS
jgi:RNA recognition motif-containing protein